MVQTHKLFTCVCVSVNDSLEAVLLMALSFMPFLRKAVLIARSFFLCDQVIIEHEYYKIHSYHFMRPV